MQVLNRKGKTKKNTLAVFAQKSLIFTGVKEVERSGAYKIPLKHVKV